MSRSPVCNPSGGLFRRRGGRLTGRTIAISAGLLATAIAIACSSEEAPSSQASPPNPPAATASPSGPTLPNGIVLALAQFITEKGPDGKSVSKPGPARLEFLFQRDGQWQTSILEDPESNVFHKAMIYPGATGPELITLAGSAATVKGWRKGASGLESTTYWQKDFGGKHSRMRDAEVGDVYGDGKASLVVATHDQGVVAVLRPREGGGFDVTVLDEKPNTFVHEIEIGDLDGDGVVEIYATPSEPNRLDGTPQSGEVVRYVPAKNEGRVVVAALGDRHAKEVLVADIDGDGRDELYVSVEGHVNPDTNELDQPVEIRRFEADTPADQGAVIAILQDRLCRFLTAGDVDGDGKLELVAATFSAGLWLLRPGADPNQMWESELIDRNSAGFEHAAILTDLDGDGRDELYVASDKHKELRRYVWHGATAERETIYKRPDNRPIFTWNLMPVPVELIP